jgi:hypothetical protein
MLKKTYISRPNETESIGWTCQQQGRLLDPTRPGTATDIFGNANDLGTGAADKLVISATYNSGIYDWTVYA